MIIVKPGIDRDGEGSFLDSGQEAHVAQEDGGLEEDLAATNKTNVAKQRPQVLCEPPIRPLLPIDSEQQAEVQVSAMNQLTLGVLSNNRCAAPFDFIHDVVKQKILQWNAGGVCNAADLQAVVPHGLQHALSNALEGLGVLDEFEQVLGHEAYEALEVLDHGADCLSCGSHGLLPALRSWQVQVHDFPAGHFVQRIPLKLGVGRVMQWVDVTAVGIEWQTNSIRCKQGTCYYRQAAQNPRVCHDGNGPVLS
mmetsp:Transcript_32637/g.52514  ORF Transcript_32637/g.52514 Transcript_32637/m.52514 type:complete len:251 (+) Transcript_32637:726-1478(+)